jgi:hypothetical protein
MTGMKEMYKNRAGRQRNIWLGGKEMAKTLV